MSQFDHPEFGYQTTMQLIHARLVAMENMHEDYKLFRVEALAFGLRKIIEGVAFAALSVAEYHNPRLPRSNRTKDPSQLLAWLDSKALLRLPEAGELLPPSDASHVAVLHGRPELNLSLKRIKAVYSRASAFVHERHPERLTDQVVSTELDALYQDARDLKAWLWTHVTFIHGQAFCIRMDRIGEADFWMGLAKEEPPAS